MFAILISPDTVPKIEASALLDDHALRYMKAYFIDRRYYLVRGYVTPGGRLGTFAFFPHYMFATRFEYDEDKIKTDWDQIVRR